MQLGGGPLGRGVLWCAGLALRPAPPRRSNHQKTAQEQALALALGRWDHPDVARWWHSKVAKGVCAELGRDWTSAFRGQLWRGQPVWPSRQATVIGP